MVAPDEAGEPSSGLLDVLKARGLTPSEVACYRALVGAGTATPAQVARGSGQSRGRTYEVLRLLAQKGFVREEPTRPIRFWAIPLAEVLKRTLADIKAQQRQLEAVQRTLPPKSIDAIGEETVGVHNVAVITGRKAVALEMRRMAQDANRFLYVMGGGHFGDRVAPAPALLEALRAAHERGVDVELFLVEASTGSAAVDTIRHALGDGVIYWIPPEKAVHTAYAANERVGMIIIVQPDDRAALRGDDLAIRFESQALVDTFVHRMRQTEAGAASAMMSPGLIGRRYGDAVTTARKQIVGMCPRGWAEMILQAGPEIERLHDEAKARGVRLRAILEKGSFEAEALRPVMETWEIRAAPSVPGAIAVVDHTSLFQGYPDEETEGLHASFSTEPHQVKHYAQVFERLWSESQPLVLTAATPPPPKSVGA